MTSPRNSAPRVDTSAINHAPISALSGEIIVLMFSGFIFCFAPFGFIRLGCNKRQNY